MKMQLISDVHVEFHADGGAGFLRALDATGVDLLVVAGDLGLARDLAGAFAILCAKYPAVAFVLGNHELYTSRPHAVEAHMAEIAARHRNLHWLDESAVVIGGQRVVGTSLWFGSDAGAEADRLRLNDFRAIDGFADWVFAKNAHAQKFLRENVRPGDVVVTHHLPSWRCTHPKYAGSPLNKYFVCDLEPLIVARQPRYWLFGHTHERVREVVGACTLVANPFGYARVEPESNAAFDERLILDV
jgi:predicted phosphodiesterase